MAAHGGNRTTSLSWNDVGVSPGWPEGGPALPAGTVTFLLTDIEGSSALWATEPHAMAAAVARHYEILDTAIAAHDGVRPLEQGEGDSIVAAFTRASDAVLAALDAQRALTAEPWPTAMAPRVRMAVHTGEARLRDAENYAGPAIIRTARLRAIVHGGQIVVSASARDLAVDEVAPPVEFVDLGVHRLKDLARPEHVWQVVHPDLPSRFPALRSLDAVPNNLPVALSSFVGRAAEVATVSRFVRDHRLVTLTGSGGAGKTRLAQQVAAEVADTFTDGVWWVDLAAVTEPGLLPSAVSRAASLPEDGADLLGGLTQRLATKRSLVVLDNCEHLRDECAALTAAILTACPDVGVLATSRAPLNVPGELSWRVPPLSLPGPGPHDEPTESFAQYDAVRLFVDRATGARQNFRLTAENARTITELCARLDGVPLAIELAAARCRVLTPAQILGGLTDAMGMLATGPSIAQPRHQTIEASIAWSHSLLSVPEQVLLRRLAVFAGSFTLDAAEGVTSDELLARSSVLDLLERLVDQSLVQLDDGDSSESRFRLLETVRQFARAQLEFADETAVLADRHARYFADRARSLWPLFHHGMGTLLDRADADFDDLVSMLAYLHAHATAEECGETAAACLPAIAIRHATEAQTWGDRVVERLEPTSLLAGTLHLQLALVATLAEDLGRHIQGAAAASAATGDESLGALLGFFGAWQAMFEEPTADQRASLRAAAERLAATGDTHLAFAVDWMLALALRTLGHADDATRHVERALERVACVRCNTMVRTQAAALALARGDLDGARAAVAEARRFGLDVRDADFLGAVRLAEHEIALYAGDSIPERTAADELRAAIATRRPAAAGFLREALALGRYAAGDLEAAHDALVDAIAAVDAEWIRSTDSRLRLAGVRHALGDHDGAAAIVTELRDHMRTYDNGPLLAARIDHRDAALAFDRGRVEDAEETAQRALAAAASGPWPAEVVDALEVLAAVAARRESFAESTRLAGAAARQREDHGYRQRLTPERERLERALAEARTALGADESDTAFAAGYDLTLADTLAYARRARGERRRPSRGWEGLTPTERQVADLAVAGLTNAQIAARLFVGRETVKTHLSNVYAKVGVANRAQLVAAAAASGHLPEEDRSR